MRYFFSNVYLSLEGLPEPFRDQTGNKNYTLENLYLILAFILCYAKLIWANIKEASENKHKIVHICCEEANPLFILCTCYTNIVNFGQGQTGPNMTKKGQTGPNGAKWGQTGPNGAKWGQTGPNGAIGAKRGQMRPNGAKQGQTVPNRVKYGFILSRDSNQLYSPFFKILVSTPYGQNKGFLHKNHFSKECESWL